MHKHTHHTLTYRHTAQLRLELLKAFTVNYNKLIAATSFNMSFCHKHTNMHSMIVTDVALLSVHRMLL